LQRQFNLYYFKVDDYLDKYAAKASAKQNPFSVKILNMSADEIWLRDPKEQNDDELETYHEMFEFILEDLDKINGTKDVITEGTAFYLN